MTCDESYLNADDAIAIVAEGDEVHTLRSPAGGFLIGADWPRAKLLDAIRTTDTRRLAGPVASSMGHGLAIWAGEWLYIATRDTSTVPAVQEGK